MLKYLDHLVDSRVDCYSILMKIKIKDYLEFIEKIYKDKGGIPGQRAPLKTKSAQRIRKRLIEDLKKGTVIPPIVLGLQLNDENYKSLIENVQSNSLKIFDGIVVEEQVSIIDGMQRTTALYEATLPPVSKNIDTKNTPEADKVILSMSKVSLLNVDAEIRLEIWVAKTTNSLIYRMLVLNSGQIPWNIKRQLEVVFSQLKKEMLSNISGLELYTSDDNDSRKEAGQYQASQFIELFMLFGARRSSIDIQEELAEEFARLDIIETSGNNEFMSMFYGICNLLVTLDQQFSRVIPDKSEVVLAKYKSGKLIFSSQPARAGFMVAAAQEIFGIPGVEYSVDHQKDKYEKLHSATKKFISKLSDNDASSIENILDIPTLDEQTNIKSSKVGEFERTFFLSSFKTFFDLAKSDSLTSMTPCWRTSY